jgi:hypothetical protein
MLKSVYDTNANGIVDNAEKVNNLTVETAVPAGAVFTDTVFDDTDILDELDLKAPLISPVFTGSPAVPTAPTNTSTTLIANTAFVQQELLRVAGDFIDDSSELSNKTWSSAKIRSELTGTKLTGEDA